MPGRLRSAISRPQRAQAGALGSAASRARGCQIAVACQEAGGVCAVHLGLQGIADACGPGSPGSHPGGLGPHLTSSGFPRRAFLRFPVCPPGSPPSPAFGWFPVVRRSPVRSLRPLPGSGSGSVSLRVPFPLSDLYVSAAAGRLPQALVPGGRDQGHQSCRGPLAWIAVIRPHCRRAAPGARGCRHRIACHERPRAQDIAAPGSIRRISGARESGRRGWRCRASGAWVRRTCAIPGRAMCTPG